MSQEDVKENLVNPSFWSDSSTNQLRELLQFYSLSKRGNKEQLIKRLINYFSIDNGAIDFFASALKQNPSSELKEVVFSILSNRERRFFQEPKIFYLLQSSDASSIWDICLSKSELVDLAHQLDFDTIQDKKSLIVQMIEYLNSKLISFSKDEIESINQSKSEKDAIFRLVSLTLLHFPIPLQKNEMSLELSSILRVPYLKKGIEPSYRPRIPMPVPIPRGVSEKKIIDYLYLSDNPIKLRDRESLINDMTNQSYPYGIVKGRNLLRYVGEFLPLPGKSVRDSIDERISFFPHPESNLWEHLNRFFHLFSSALGKVETSFSKREETHLDASELGLDEVYCLYLDGFPQVEMRVGGTKLRTGLYGIESDPRCLREIDGLPLESAVSLFKLSNSLLRKLEFAILNHPELELDRFPSSEGAILYHLIRPFTVIRQLMEFKSFHLPLNKENLTLFLHTYFSPPKISRGTQYLLRRFFELHPELTQHLYPDRGFDSQLEDRIPPSLWEKIPERIKERISPVKLVESPSSLLPSWVINKLANQRLDEYEILKLSPEEVVSFEFRRVEGGGFISVPEIFYYFACRGLDLSSEEFFSSTSDLYLDAIKLASEILDAGGIGQTENEANPLPGIEKMVEIPEYAPYLNIYTHLLKIPYGLLLGKEGLKTILYRGYIYPLPLEEKVIQRYQLWNDSSSIQRLLYQNISEERVRNGVDFAKSEENPLERYIRRYNEENGKELNKELGLVPPRRIDANTYFELSIRSINSSPKTDEEILFEELKLYPVYTSRSELIEIARALETERHFFVPIVRRCRNKISLDFVDDLTDPKVYLIGYGTRDDYLGYTLSNLVASFTLHEGCFGFSLPQPMNEDEIERVSGASGTELLHYQRRSQRIFIELGVREAEELYQLTLMLPGELNDEERRERDELQRRIKRYLMTQRNITEDEREMIQFFSRSIPSEAKELMRRFLFQIFEMGMYFRQWRGVGHPYPLRSRDVAPEKGFDQNSDLLQHELELDRIRDSFSERGYSRWYEWLRKLPGVSWTGGSRHSYDIPIGKMLDDVRIGHNCIRMASSIWISTGAHYLSILFHETIPDFNFEELESTY